MVHIDLEGLGQMLQETTRGNSSIKTTNKGPNYYGGGFSDRHNPYS